MHVLDAIEDPEADMNLDAWEVIDGIPSETITARIHPDCRYRVVCVCLNNGMSTNFSVYSFKTCGEV